MAKVTNAFETRDAKGNREDLENAIYNIDPSDTPFMTLAGRRTVKNTSFDWQTEALPTADDTNAQEEGFTLTRTAADDEGNVRALHAVDADVALAPDRGFAASSTTRPTTPCCCSPSAPSW